MTDDELKALREQFRGVGAPVARIIHRLIDALEEARGVCHKQGCGHCSECVEEARRETAAVRMNTPSSGTIEDLSGVAARYATLLRQCEEALDDSVALGKIAGDRADSARAIAFKEARRHIETHWDEVDDASDLLKLAPLPPSLVAVPREVLEQVKKVLSREHYGYCVCGRTPACSVDCRAALKALEEATP